MMSRKRDHVLIRPDGFYGVFTTLKSQKPRVIEKTYEKETDIIPLLRLDCEVDPETTIGDIFRAVRDNKPLKDFISAYAHCSQVDLHLSELDESPDPDDPLMASSPMVGEFFWHASITNLKGKRPEMGTKCGFHGQGTEIDPDHGCIVSYGLMGCHLSELAKLKVQFKTDIDLNAYDDKGNLVQRLEFQHEFSLLDILEALFWEISWFGPPPKKYNALKDALDESPEKAGG